MITSARSKRTPECSIVVPVFNAAAATRDCLDALVASEDEAAFEVIVVDDASDDETTALLRSYGGLLRVLRHSTNEGFALACNDGAAAARAPFTLFLNSDTVPRSGWLDAIVEHARSHPAAAAVGAKLLYPDHTVQHAGVVICQDRNPRHIYAGFPEDHPAVNRSRRFQVVTGACMLVRRSLFQEVGGFDSAFRNGYEDVDLCLRLGAHGHEVHYCHRSMLRHLEGASRQGRAQEVSANQRLYQQRWSQRVQPDDIRYYIDDGLLSLDYGTAYPVTLSVSPLLATVSLTPGSTREVERLLNARSHQVFELLRQNDSLAARMSPAVDRVRAPVSARSTAGGSCRFRLRRQGRPRRLGARNERLVSVIIPTKNGGPQIRELLPRILGQEWEGFVEIVAVDSGSEDDTLDLLTSVDATVVDLDPPDFNHGTVRNLGARFARGDPLVFLTQGALPDSNRWLAPLVRALDGDPQIAGVCSRVVPRGDADLLTRRDGHQDPSASPEPAVRVVAATEEYRSLSPHELRLFINFHTVSAAIRPAVLGRIPFARVVTIGEDLLWAKQALEAGYKIRHEPASVVEHSHRYSLAELLQRNYDDAVANRQIVDRRFPLSALEDLIAARVWDDWRALRAAGLRPADLDGWQLRSAMRRTAQALGQWLGANQTDLSLAANDLLLSLTARLRAGLTDEAPGRRDAAFASSHPAPLTTAE